ncbi:transcription cofactor vestigial-like protein 1, partial [Striga asiatica]
IVEKEGRRHTSLGIGSSVISKIRSPFRFDHAQKIFDKMPKRANKIFSKPPEQTEGRRQLAAVPQTRAMFREWPLSIPATKTSDAIPSSSPRSLPEAEQTQLEVAGFPSVNVVGFSSFGQTMAAHNPQRDLVLYAPNPWTPLIGPISPIFPPLDLDPISPLAHLSHPKPSPSPPSLFSLQLLSLEPPPCPARTQPKPSSLDRTQPSLTGPNSAQPSQLAHLSSTTQTVTLRPAKSFLSAAQKIIPKPLSYGSISLSGSIPNVYFSPPETNSPSASPPMRLFGRTLLFWVSPDAKRISSMPITSLSNSTTQTRLRNFS